MLSKDKIMFLEKPIIAINFKTYKESLGDNALEIAKAIEEINPHLKAKCLPVVVPQTVDIRLIAKETTIPVFAQHGEAFDYGKNTGYTTIKSLKNAGVTGMLINHSEHKLALNKIEETIIAAKKEDLYSICCVDTIDQARAVACFSPTYIALEPPELIGTDVSIAQKDPEIIEKVVKKIKFIQPNAHVLIGAGIKTRKDVEICIENGASGVLLASGVTKAKDIPTVLFDFFGR